MISLLLFYKIFQLFVFMLLGFILVKTKVVKSEESKILSKISLYLLMPAVIINSFDIPKSDDIVKGLLFAFGAAIAIHILLFIIGGGYKKLFNGKSVEVASIVYPNAANLIVPIVSFILGDEWIIYSVAFVSVQIVCLWTHGIGLFRKEKINVKKILCNPNIIAIVVGMVIMFSGLGLPDVAKGVIEPLGTMVGPVGMLIAGMLAANVDYLKVLKNGRLYLVLGMRMVVCPLIVLFLVKAFQVSPVVNVEKILLISYLASITPPASTITQFAQITDNDADFAVSVNIICTLVCIATMPVFVFFYNM